MPRGSGFDQVDERKVLFSDTLSLLVCGFPVKREGELPFSSGWEPLCDDVQSSRFLELVVGFSHLMQRHSSALADLLDGDHLRGLVGDLSLQAPLRLEIHKVKRHRTHGEADIRRREDAHDGQQEAAVLQTRLEQAC
jgi:hypothetical protein